MSKCNHIYRFKATIDIDGTPLVVKVDNCCLTPIGQDYPWYVCKHCPECGVKL